MAGWNTKAGRILNEAVDEDTYWSFFNYLFSDACRKRNTYKYGLLKSILDSLFGAQIVQSGFYIPFQELFARFTENYWNLVIQFDLRQMRPDGRSEFSKIETILMEAAKKNSILQRIAFDSVDVELKSQIVTAVTTECKKYVLGALYSDFEGTLYAFDIKGEGITLANNAYLFMLKYKCELERLNYYSWAKFLETINNDSKLIRVIDKLELGYPQRTDLSVYRQILYEEFEEHTCFYCGKKLLNSMHVDHFIPWSFTKDDRMWNFVMSCPKCNERKNNRVPRKQLLSRIITRNTSLKGLDNSIVQLDFAIYTDDLLPRMWEYAKLSGLKEYRD